MKRCITCGKEHDRKGLYCPTRLCQCGSNQISEHLLDGNLLDFETTRKFFIETKDISRRPFKELLIENRDYLYSAYKHISWSIFLQEIRYCIIEGIESQPICVHCGNKTRFIPMLGKNSINDNNIYTRYPTYCVNCKTVKAKEGFSELRKEKESEEILLPLEELLSKIEKFRNTRLDQIQNEIIFNGLMYSLKYHTKFIDESVNRKITSSERLVALWNGLTELPKCCVCGEVGVKYTRAIKQHMEWCSQKCQQTIAVLRNKTDAEIFEIDKKRKDTQRKNGTLAKSPMSQELFMKLYELLSKPDNVYFSDLNKELTIKISSGANRYVDFCYGNNIIEFYGDNVHGTPYKFREDDLYDYYKTTNKLVGEKWKADHKRINDIIEQGYRVLIIWSGEYIRNKDLIIDKCMKFLEK